jgi:nitric oxide reductase subunit B
MGPRALVAPDWSADWLHREAMAWLDLRAQKQAGKPYSNLSAGERARLQADLKPDTRANGFDPVSNTLTVPAERAQAIAKVAAHYQSLFSSDPATADLRKGYAMKEGTFDTDDHRRALAAFFF